MMRQLVIYKCRQICLLLLIEKSSSPKVNLALLHVVVSDESFPDLNNGVANRFETLPILKDANCPRQLVHEEIVIGA